MIMKNLIFWKSTHLPGLNPEYSDLCIEAKAAAWSYEELVNRILDEAIERQELT